MYTSAQVLELFNRHSILIGTQDGVPTAAVAALFGEDAAAFGFGTPGQHSNVYGVGDYYLNYLTFKGFQRAATFKSIEEIRKAELSENPSFNDAMINVSKACRAFINAATVPVSNLTVDDYTLREKLHKALDRLNHDGLDHIGAVMCDQLKMRVAELIKL